MENLEKIMDRMFLAADKWSKVAAEEQKSTVVLRAISIVENSLRVRKNLKSESTFILDHFLQHIDQGIMKRVLYQLYVETCDNLGINAMESFEFFQQVINRGFVENRSSKGMTFKPKNMTRAKIADESYFRDKLMGLPLDIQVERD